MIDPEKIRKVKLVLFDLMGVLIIDRDDFDEDLLVSKIQFLSSIVKDSGIRIGIISGSKVGISAEKLKSAGIDLILNSSIDKVSVVDDFLKNDELEYENIFYVGDDMLDIPLLERVGVSIAPVNSPRSVKRIVDQVLGTSGDSDIITEVAKILIDSRDNSN